MNEVLKPLSAYSDAEVESMDLETLAQLPPDPVEVESSAQGVSPGAEDEDGVTETPAKGVSQSADSGSNEENPGDVTGGADDDGESSDGTVDGADSSSALSEDEDDDDLNSDDSDDTSVDDQSADKGKSESSEQDTDDGDVNYKAEYERLLQPFKAAKRMVSIGNIEDARKLMQKGVDYSRKMEVLKPHMKVLRALEKAELLDPTRINFLIDLDQKNPEAIKKLLREAEIDPLSVNLKDGENYTPTDHTPSDAELNVRDVLETIQFSPKFEQTVELITTGLDTKSRVELQKNPEIIATLHEHLETGVYERVMDEVENAKLLGKIPPGLSDLQAYYHVGDSMYKAGAFKDLEPATSPATTDNSHEGTVQNPGSQSQNETKRAQMRKAAAPTRGKPVKKGGKAELPDFSQMSDDEFTKAIEKLNLSALT